MSLFRRRLMMAAFAGGGTPPSWNYVQNGLILHLDGIEKGAQSDRWKSVVGDSYFLYNEHSTKETISVLFDGLGYLTESNPIFQDVEGCTIELCAQFVSTNAYNFIYGSVLESGETYDPASVAFMSRGAFSLGSFNHNGKNGLRFTNTSDVTSPFTFSGNLDYGYLNGVQNSGLEFESWQIPIGLGGGTQGYNSNIRIYSLRVYNRKLTKAEMLWNQTEDRIRFGISPYILFADPVVEQICATNWGDGVGITPAQAAAVTSQQFGFTFQSNTQITSFDELQYFTNLVNFGDDRFLNCSNLASVVLPETMQTFGSYVFHGCSALTELTLPAAITSFGFTTLGIVRLISLPTTPPSFESRYGTINSLSIYVPYSADHSILAAYQAAWTDYANLGHIYELDQNGNIPT